MRVIAGILGALLLVLAGSEAAHAEASPPTGERPFVVLPKPGKKIPLDAGRYFVFSFSKRPAMETIVVKVEVFTDDGRKDTSLEVLGDADMPSMKGAHALGNRPFQLSKKGAYLLPVTFVMPGDWEVYFTFRRGETVVFTGRYAFDI